MNLDGWMKLVNRIMGKHLPPEHPTGRVCSGCHKVIGKHDKYRIRVAEHLSCAHPQGSPLPKSLAENRDALTEAQ